jgi:propionate CoA-transferase
MSFVEEGRVLLRLARWGLAMARHDARFPSPVPDNPKFMSPRAAVGLIRDGSVVAASGLGTHHRASILYWAIRETFAQTGRPRGLTVMNIGGHGGRGILPGTLDELARPGLCGRFVTSHFETFHEFLQLGAAGQCELQCLPLGVIALLFDALGRGKSSIVTDTGIGTFIDPRIGRGSPVAKRRFEQLVSVAGKRLRYRLPRIDVALFNLPAADRRGNVYAKNSAMIGDSYEIARAAKRNGGLVIANVGVLVDQGYDRVFLPAKMVDAIVYYPDTEQTLGFFHRDPWLAITPRGAPGIEAALEHARWTRRWGELLGAFPRRSAVDEAVVRLAAVTLRGQVARGADVVLGTGMPEDVGGVLFEHGGLNDLTLLIESGTVGGLPAPGAYFGAAFSPRAIVSTAQLFKRCYRKLDAACLGALEVDAQGNVNVSKRGPDVEKYLGPGGFIDFTAAAQTVIFVCGWMRGGTMEVEDGAVHLRKRGESKFVRRVLEVTFNGPRSLRAGKKIFYATPVGLFRLTRRGLELSNVFPGIDVRRDVLDVSPAKIVLPPSGRVPILPSSIVTGEGFDLAAGYPGVTKGRSRPPARRRTLRAAATASGR